MLKPTPHLRRKTYRLPKKGISPVSKISLAKYAQTQLLATQQVEALLEAERAKVAAGAYRRALDDTLTHIQHRITAWESYLSARSHAETTAARAKELGLA